MAAGELRNRIVAGLVLGAVAIGLPLLDMFTGNHWGTLTVALGLVFAGAFEYRLLLRPLASEIRFLPIMGTGVLLVCLGLPGVREHADQRLGLPVVPLLLALALTWASVAHMARRGVEGFVVNVGATVLGMVWIGLCAHLVTVLGCLTAVDNPVRGAQLLLITLATCKFGDIFAYGGGRLFGRHKMIPRVSPGKTWEGFAFSLLGSVGGAYLATWALSGSWMAYPISPFPNWLAPLFFGLVVGPAGALGDLIESCFKRSLQVKDSGNVVPGFGGVLDVIDAILVAVPVACLMSWVLS